MSTTHEDFGRAIRSKGPSDRNFGFVFTAVFLILGLAPLRHHQPVRGWLLIGSAVLLAATILRPGVLHGPNRLWTRCGVLLGRVVSPVVTSLLFYLVFTPVAVVLHWRGKDLLRLKFEPQSKTYWIPRDPGALADMRNQF